MSFMDAVVESEAEERARLAKAPVGSTTHELSWLPVNITQWPEGLIINLPRLPYVDGALPEHDIVVVPVRYSPESPATKSDLPAPQKHYRNGGQWTCIVVASNHASYPVGGHRLSIPAAQLVRGTQFILPI